MAYVARHTPFGGVHTPATPRPRTPSPRAGWQASRTLLRARGLDDDLAHNPTLVLLRRYDALCNPSGAGVTANQALTDLVDTCLDLFALGFDEAGLVAEAQRLRPGEGTAQEASDLAGVAADSGLADCLALIFITLSSLPAETVTRWSAAAPVSERSLARWRGFCLLIVNAYFHSGMAWFSIAKLQVEQSLTLGAAEPAPVVAERMSIVYQVRVAHCAHCTPALTPACCVRAADAEHRRAAVPIPPRLIVDRRRAVFCLAPTLGDAAPLYPVCYDLYPVS